MKSSVVGFVLVAVLALAGVAEAFPGRNARPRGRGTFLPRALAFRSGVGHFGHQQFFRGSDLYAPRVQFFRAVDLVEDDCDGLVTVPRRLLRRY